ncbi:MARVEL-like domain protein [Cordyceps fumosorosea ARSEF 2679]|uniref:MARVEL-like domain protein n=1 Tax=Cordyceps fumosorosea (strain ARSEF 2679) TaxID=1081104 RepID=A0A166XK26_CORFA|nr:MARVEL-like domain protein [Cordyceps fumosorosea ARSEF 2679]OAA35901.1 MARVEL-like domain protein [Cordyceps fumosorosea ARSEF 2679]
MATEPIRVLAFVNHLIVWVSSLIVTGILSYFLSKYSLSNNTHVIYEEVIAVITLAFWIPAMVLPIVGKYGGHLWPFNLIFSYLWLTAFIFSAQDWSRGRCTFSDFFSRCGLKRTVIAFNFFAFFFLFCNVVVENRLYYRHRNEGVTAPMTGHRKRPETAETAETAETTQSATAAV